MNALFGLGRQNIAHKQMDLSAAGDTLKATLLSMSSATGKITLISSSTNASPIVVTTTTTHGYTTGDIVVIGGHATNTCANGTWQLGTTTSTTFQLLTRLDAINSTGNGVGGATGWCIDLSSASVLTDVSGNSVGTDQTIPGQTNTLGVINANSWTWTNLPATKIWAIAIYDSTASNDLIAFIDGTYQVYMVTQAAASSTALAVNRLAAVLSSNPLPTMSFSDGTTATLTSANVVGDTSLAVSSTGAIIHRQATADVQTSGSGLPVTPAAGGQLTFNVDSGVNKLFAI